MCLLSFALVSSAFVSSFAQKRNTNEFGFGASFIYNFQTESFGADVRGYYLLKDRVAVVPELSYFFSFNPIHELYAGISVHYLFRFFKKYRPYLAASAFYNNWFNAEEYKEGLKKQQNFAPEVGIGIIRAKGCVRPFIETRYDVKWKEANLRIGVLFFLKSCKDRRKNGDNCPILYSFN